MRASSIMKSRISVKPATSAHNLMYWNNAEYYGFGAGASGYVDGVRYKNHVPIHHYLEHADKQVVKKNSHSRNRWKKNFFGATEEIRGQYQAVF